MLPQKKGHIKFSAHKLFFTDLHIYKIDLIQAFKVTIHCITSTHIIIEYNLPEAFCCSSWLAVNSILANGTFTFLLIGGSRTLKIFG